MSRKETTRKNYRAGKDVPLMHKMPSPEEVSSKQSFLCKVGESFGFQEWMWKAWTGRILAIIVVPPAVAAAYDFWKPKVEHSYQFVETYVSTLKRYSLKTTPNLIGFTGSSGQHVAGQTNDLLALAPALSWETPNLPQLNGSLTKLTVWRVFSNPLLTEIAAELETWRSGVGTPNNRWVPRNSGVSQVALDPYLALAEIRPSLRTPRTGPYITMQMTATALVSFVSPSQLPNDWITQKTLTRLIGTEWIRENESGILCVPSAIDPSKFNALINFKHPSVSVSINQVALG